jgi:hypothetical protein
MSGLPGRGTVQSIVFATLNSTYFFEWVTGERYGILTGVTGTFEGRKFPVETESIRDLVYPGEMPVLDVLNVEGGPDTIYLTRVTNSLRKTWDGLSS